MSQTGTAAPFDGRMSLWAQYRKTRAKYPLYPARVCLQLVRDQSAADATTWQFDEVFQQAGFDILIRVKPDDCPDLSQLGKFTDSPSHGYHHSQGYFLRNPDGWHTWRDHRVWNGHDEPQFVRGGTRRNFRNFAYFELADPVPTVAHDLIVNCKYGRREAWEIAWAQAKAELETALQYEAYGVIVTVSRHGITLGEDPCGD